jgi:mRNA interferase RelE/StbE
MGKYKIFFRESVWKDFKSIPKKDLRKIIHRIDSLAENPRPAGSQKLSRHERYRIRHRAATVLCTQSRMMNSQSGL